MRLTKTRRRKKQIYNLIRAYIRNATWIFYMKKIAFNREKCVYRNRERAIGCLFLLNLLDFSTIYQPAENSVSNSGVLSFDGLAVYQRLCTISVNENSCTADAGGVCVRVCVRRLNARFTKKKKKQLITDCLIWHFNCKLIQIRIYLIFVVHFLFIFSLFCLFYSIAHRIYIVNVIEYCICYRCFAGLLSTILPAVKIVTQLRVSVCVCLFFLFYCNLLAISVTVAYKHLNGSLFQLHIF